MTTLRLLIAHVPATACIAAATILAFYERDGWGWFLFAALLFGSTSLVPQKATEAE
ncbi:hypothetical protein [Rubrivirga sp. IMCC45206]|uniref:hypothetical protein n=1 Tax=Rubrivirga sp. IMCC45206 TaxID=3391614 RepID=UPI00398FF9C2